MLTEDYPIHQLMMREYRVTVESAAKRAWLAANDDFRDVERHFTMGRYPGLDLERASWAQPVRVSVSYAGPVAFGVS